MGFITVWSVVLCTIQNDSTMVLWNLDKDLSAIPRLENSLFAICEILSGSNFEEIKEHLKFIPSPGGSS